MLFPFGAPPVPPRLTGLTFPTTLPTTLLSQGTIADLDGVRHDVDSFLHSPLATGLACYTLGMVALIVWDRRDRVRAIVGRLRTDRRLSHEEHRLHFLTPLTCDHSIPLPELDELEAKERHFVGRIDRVNQFISTNTSAPLASGVSEIGDEWSRHYGVPVVVSKEKVR